MLYLVLLLLLLGCITTNPPGPPPTQVDSRLDRVVDHAAQVVCWRYRDGGNRVGLSCLPCSQVPPAVCGDPHAL